MQANYVHLSESVNDDTDYKVVKQKTDAWFEVRKQSVVTTKYSYRFGQFKKTVRTFRHGSIRERKNGIF